MERQLTVLVAVFEELMPLFYVIWNPESSCIGTPRSAGTVACLACWWRLNVFSKYLLSYRNGSILAYLSYIFVCRRQDCRRDCQKRITQAVTTVRGLAGSRLGLRLDCAVHADKGMNSVIGQ